MTEKMYNRKANYQRESLAQIYKYIKSDWKRLDSNYNKKNSSLFLCVLLGGLGYPGFCFQFWLRLCKTKVFPLRIFARWMHRRYRQKYCLHINPNVNIGYGLLLAHGCNVMVNNTATIGNNCTLHQFNVIGSNSRNAATLGDNVYVGPNVCIVEDVTIGDNVTIGAGAVVVKDIPDNATVGGVPAKVLNYNNPGRFIKSLNVKSD